MLDILEKREMRDWWILRVKFRLWNKCEPIIIAETMTSSRMGIVASMGMPGLGSGSGRWWKPDEAIRIRP